MRDPEDRKATAYPGLCADTASLGDSGGLPGAGKDWTAAVDFLACAAVLGFFVFFSSSVFPQRRVLGYGADASGWLCFSGMEQCSGDRFSEGNCRGFSGL